MVFVWSVECPALLMDLAASPESGRQFLFLHYRILYEVFPLLIFYSFLRRIVAAVGFADCCNRSVLFRIPAQLQSTITHRPLYVEEVITKMWGCRKKNISILPAKTTSVPGSGVAPHGREEKGGGVVLERILAVSADCNVDDVQYLYFVCPPTSADNKSIVPTVMPRYRERHTQSRTKFDCKSTIPWPVFYRVFLPHRKVVAACAVLFTNRSVKRPSFFVGNVCHDNQATRRSKKNVAFKASNLSKAGACSKRCTISQRGDNRQSGLLVKSCTTLNPSPLSTCSTLPDDVDTPLRWLVDGAKEDFGLLEGTMVHLLSGMMHAQVREFLRKG